MSTRCNIRIINKEWNESFMLYHHYDGYPSGVGMDLKHYLKTKEHLPYWSAMDFANELIKGVKSEMYEEVDNRYEITSSMHGDIEYLYVIDCDKRDFKCYAVPWGKSEEEVCVEKNLREIKPE